MNLDWRIVAGGTAILMIVLALGVWFYGNSRYNAGVKDEKAVWDQANFDAQVKSDADKKASQDLADHTDSVVIQKQNDYKNSYQAFKEDSQNEVAKSVVPDCVVDPGLVRSFNDHFSKTAIH